MPNLALILFLFCITNLYAGENAYTVLWKLDLQKEISKNKYSFSEISEYLYTNTDSKKVIFYTDSACKNKVIKDKFTQNLFEKNQSVSGYTIIKIQESWKFSTEGIASKVIFLCFENPELPSNDLYRNLYVPQKYISTILNEITLSGYYHGRANIPLGEWIKKHDFEYTILKTTPDLPKQSYTFQYNKIIDDTTYKRIQILFDFFPENNTVFNRTYKRDKNALEELSHLHTYNNETQSTAFRNILLEALQKNKLIKSNPDIDNVLAEATSTNYVFYFEAIQESTELKWTNLRVYVSSGIHSTFPQSLCADVPKNKIKAIESYFKKNAPYSFTEYFTKIKIDFLVSYINNSFAKDAEEGLILRQYLFSF